MDSSLEYQIDITHQCALVTYHARPEFSEWKATMDLLFADPRFRSNFAIVLDATRVPNPPAIECVGEAVRYIDSKIERFPMLRWAMVAANASSFRVGQMAEKMVRINSLRTFGSVKEAMAWVVE